MPHCYCCSYCALLNCETFTHVDIIVCLFVIHVWHPRFPLNGMKKYSTTLAKTVTHSTHPLTVASSCMFLFLDFFFLPGQTCRCYSGCQTTGPPYKPAPEAKNGSVAVARTQITRVQKPQRDKTKDHHHHRHSGLALAMTVNPADL